MLKTVVMPAAGQTTDAATVTELRVAVGDAVRRGDVLLEVETDKAVLPIESFASGVVAEIFVKESDTVDAGTPLLSIGDENDLRAVPEKRSGTSGAASGKESEEETGEDDFVPVLPPEEAPEAASPARTGYSAMPSAKRAAAQLGISIGELTPENGTFLKVSDVKKAAGPDRSASYAAEEKTVPAGRIRTALARRMESGSNIPVFSVCICADDRAYRTLAEADADITPAHYVIFALSRLAARYPLLRTRNEDMKLTESDMPCIGYAVYGENGTVAPVLDRQTLQSVSAIARRCAECRSAVLRGDLSSVRSASAVVHDMTGYSVNMFIAPVVSPSVASFGITHADTQITVSGSFDMRAAEGNTGASIMEDLGKLLGSPVLMLV